MFVQAATRTSERISTAPASRLTQGERAGDLQGAQEEEMDGVGGSSISSDIPASVPQGFPFYSAAWSDHFRDLCLLYGLVL